MRVPSRSSGRQTGPGVVPTAPVRRLPGPSPVRPSPTRPSPTEPDLAAYRAAVAELLVEVGALADAPSAAARQLLLDQRLREPAITAVLDATPQGFLGARETLLLEMARYQPNARSSASDLTALVRIYLLSRIDVMWWRDTPIFSTDASIWAPDMRMSCSTCPRRRPRPMRAIGDIRAASSATIARMRSTISSSMPAASSACTSGPA